MAAQPTSRYDSSIKVKQEVIDRIKKMGMGAAVKAANSGNESAEFVEGAKRMYGRDRVSAMNDANLKRDQQTTAKTGRAAPSLDGGKTGTTGTGEKKSVPMPKSAPAAATRKVGGNAVGSGVLGENNAQWVSRNVSKPVSGAVSAVAKSLDGGGKGKGVGGAIGRFWHKNVGKPLSRSF